MLCSHISIHENEIRSLNEMLSHCRKMSSNKPADDEEDVKEELKTTKTGRKPTFSHALHHDPQLRRTLMNAVTRFYADLRSNERGLLFDVDDNVEDDDDDDDGETVDPKEARVLAAYKRAKWKEYVDENSKRG